MKKHVFITGIAAALFGTLVFTSCQKEKVKATTSESTEEASRGPIVLVNQAYLAEGQLNGQCTGGPIPSYSSALYQFDAATGNNLTLELQNCNIIASAYNKVNGLMYLATRNTTNAVSELYSYNLSTNTLTFVSTLTYSNAIFYVNEMEFDANGKLYLLKTGDDSNLYYINSLSSPVINKVTGTMFGSHVGTYREALCFNSVTNELRLVYEIPQVSGAVTRVATINTSTSALGTATTYNIPGVNTNNISSYYDGSTIYFIRDNGAGVGTIYASTGSVVNTLNSRNTHDATWISVTH